ncbi:unnamed protein product [Amoebophrya sp. A120]|nr:unnamed protein product [Amoebophrya sp. A120]|eukprot:GSA120T00006563001.1
MWDVVEDAADDALVNVAIRNYLAFLWNLCQLFATLGVVNMLFLLPDVLQQGEIGDVVPIAIQLDSKHKFWRTYLVIWVSTITTLFYVHKFLRSILVPLQYSWGRHCSRTTVLLRGIPRGPRSYFFGPLLPGAAVAGGRVTATDLFDMSRRDVVRVERDLRDALVLWFVQREQQKSSMTAQERSNFEAGFYSPPVHLISPRPEHQDSIDLAASGGDGGPAARSSSSSRSDQDDPESPTLRPLEAAPWRARKVEATSAQQTPPLFGNGHRSSSKAEESSRTIVTPPGVATPVTMNSPVALLEAEKARRREPADSLSRIRLGDEYFQAEPACSSRFTDQLIARINDGKPLELAEVAREHPIVRRFLAQQSKGRSASARKGTPRGSSSRDGGLPHLSEFTGGVDQKPGVSQVEQRDTVYYAERERSASGYEFRLLDEEDNMRILAPGSSASSNELILPDTRISIDAAAAAVFASTEGGATALTTSKGRILAVHVVPSCAEVLDLQRQYADACAALAHFQDRLETVRTKLGRGNSVHAAEPVATREVHVEATISSAPLLRTGEQTHDTTSLPLPDHDNSADVPTNATTCFDRLMQSFIARVQAFLTFYWLLEAFLQIRVMYLKACLLTVSEKLVEKLTSSGSLSGLAFVTFRSSKDAKKLVRSGTFSFGRPPFQAITLEASRAPSPSDIFWSNVHVSDVWRGTVRWTLTLLLFLFLLVLVTPVVITQAITPLVNAVKNGTSRWEKYLTKALDRYDEVFWSYLTDYLPIVMLLAINTVLVPFLISWIARWQRGELRSDYDVTCLRLNLLTSTLNVVLLPLVGFTSLQALLQFEIYNAGPPPAGSRATAAVTAARTEGDEAAGLTSGANENFWLRFGESIAFSVSGVFTLRYLINCAFLTASTQLTQVSQAFYRFFMQRFVAVTDLERDTLTAPWPFDWGYWYAWSLVILFQGLFFGVCVPAVPFLASLLFYIKYRTDKYNLFYSVYSSYQEEAVDKLLPLVLQAMLLAISWMQFFVSGWLFVKIVPGLFFFSAGVDQEGTTVVSSNALLGAANRAVDQDDKASDDKGPSWYEQSQVANAATIFLLFSSFCFVFYSYYLSGLLQNALTQHVRSDTGDIEDTSASEEEWEVEWKNNPKLQHMLQNAYLPPVMDQNTKRWSAKLLQNFRIYDFLKLYE